MTKKILSVFLAALMVFSMVPFAGMTAFAETGHTYLAPVYVDDDPTKGVKEWKTKYVEADDVSEVTDSTDALSTGWYIVTGSDVKTTNLKVTGNANLILADGSKLTAKGNSNKAGITVSGDGTSLTVYAQSIGDNMGTLIATGAYNAAGIGGGRGAPGSNITVNGGNVTATGGDGDNGSAGIGGGEFDSGSNITINGGTVTATGRKGGAGIGGGEGGSGSNITVNGGTVTAISVVNGAGIGGGYNGSGSNIKVAASIPYYYVGSSASAVEKKDNDGTDIAEKIAGCRYFGIPAHTHAFEYTATGATLTATCTEGCDKSYDTTPLTLTLTEDGFDETALNTWKDAGATEPVITYYTANDTELTTPIDKPTEPVEYIVAATVMNGETPVTAQKKVTPHTHTAGEETVTFNAVSDFAALKAAFETGGKYYLAKDITATAGLTVSKDVDLCLNGKVLNLDQKGNITVNEGTSFTLCDCDTETEHNFTVGDTGLWVLDEQNGTETVTGGVITGGSAGDVLSYGSFTMNGGAICGGMTYSEWALTTGGGVSALYGGSFTMNDGKICGNISADGDGYGGGVYVENGTFTMNGGTICNNASIGDGGGVCVMSYLYEEVTLTPTLLGGTICDNTAGWVDGGGGVSSCGSVDFILGGTVVIKGNTADNQPSDLWGLASIDSDNAPEDGMEVGLYGDTIVSGASEGDEEFFFADDENYCVKYDSENEQVYLAGIETEKTITLNECENGTLSVSGEGVTVNADKIIAIPGETVTVEVEPKDGYQLDSLKYNDGEDHDITSSMTFEMPECDVTVTAELEEIPAHTHTFAAAWTSDANAHWHACTAEGCDIEDYSTCDIMEAAYAAHTFTNLVCETCDYDVKAEAKAAIDTAVGEDTAENVKAAATAAKDAIDAETVTTVEAVNDIKTAAVTLIGNLKAFNAEKVTQTAAAEALAADGDSAAATALITKAKEDIAGLAYDEAKTLDENKAALAAIVTKLGTDLAAQRLADKALADAKTAAKEAIDTAVGEDTAENVKAAAKTAKDAIDAETVTTVEAVNDIKTAAVTLIGNLKAFNTEAANQIAAVEAMAEENDSTVSQKLITDAEAEIEALTYDEGKSLNDNKAAIAAIVTKLGTDLAAQRLADAKTAAKEAIDTAVDEDTAENVKAAAKTAKADIDAETVTTIEAVNGLKEAAIALIGNLKAFNAEKVTQTAAAEALAADGDSEAATALITKAKEDIAGLAYDETKTLDENKAALAAIVTKLGTDLAAQRLADAKTAAKAAIDTAVGEDTAENVKAAAKTAKDAIDAETVTTIEAVNGLKEAAIALIGNLKAFNAEKVTQTTAAEALAADGDSEAATALITKAKEDIAGLAYDEAKTLDENKAALAAIVTKLGTDLAAQRLADAKVAAIAEINALVAEDASEEIKAVANKATKDILAAGSITSVNEIKTKAINDIKALLNTDVCEYCGKEHESFADSITCFIFRVINWIIDIFVNNGILVVR